MPTASASIASPRIRVLLVDDDQLARRGLADVLGSAADIIVVGECSDGSQVNTAITQHRPDVVLMDVRMPVVDGVMAVQLAQSLPTTPEFVMITAFDDGDMVVKAIAAGACGFLLKAEDPRMIIKSVRDVASGGSALSPQSAKHLTQWASNSVTPGTAGPGRDAQAKMGILTPREREIAIGLVTGASDAELAGELFVATSTIKSALAQIHTKWGTKNRTQIAVVVARSGAA